MCEYPLRAKLRRFLYLCFCVCVRPEKNKTTGTAVENIAAVAVNPTAAGRCSSSTAVTAGWRATLEIMIAFGDDPNLFVQEFVFWVLCGAFCCVAFERNESGMLGMNEYFYTSTKSPPLPHIQASYHIGSIK